MPDPVPSPYQLDFSSYEDSFDAYDDFPATSAWMQSVGAAIGKKFGVKVVPNSDTWEIDYDEKQMKAGSVEDIFTRRGVLGLILNGVGRLALGIKVPMTKKEAVKFAQSHQVDDKVAKHFGALFRVIDEIRTDHEIANQYAGGERVVDTMHTQAYAAAEKALKAMAVDIQIKKKVARKILDELMVAMRLTKEIENLDRGYLIDRTRDKKLNLDTRTFCASMSEMIPVLGMFLPGLMENMGMNQDITWSSKHVAAVLCAMYPQDAKTIANVFIRAYPRNVSLFGGILRFETTSPAEEQEVLDRAKEAESEMNDMKLFASHSGGHAQYVLAKAEQYYHGITLGMPVPSSLYDLEAKILEVEAANEAARELANKWYDHGVSKDVGDSIQFARDLLTVLSPFPFLDVNDQQKEEGNGTMSRRRSGASGGNRQQKKKPQKEKRSSGDRAKDRRQMESLDEEKNRKEVEEQRGGYSIFENPSIDPLKAYRYIIGPYLSRITTMAARMRRILKVNDPAGIRGAYRRGKELNSRILYRHRLDDYRLFARKEVDKTQSYGFVVMADLSGSTEKTYSKSRRFTEDEILAASFLMAEVAERIGEKVMCSLGFFSSDAASAKPAGKYLIRSKIMHDIKEHGGGTNVAAAGEQIANDLYEMSEFGIKNKTIIFITDGVFHVAEFLNTVQAAKKHKASIAYFQLDNNARMCKEVEKFVGENAKSVRIKTRNVTPSGMHGLPEALAQLMRETIISHER